MLRILKYFFALDFVLNFSTAFFAISIMSSLSGLNSVQPPRGWNFPIKGQKTDHSSCCREHEAILSAQFLTGQT